MSPKWTIGFCMLFVLGAIFSGIVEMQYLGGGETAVINRLLHPDMPSFSNPLGVVTGFISVVWGYIQALWEIFTWDFAMFQGEWALVRWGLFLCLSAGMVLSLVLVMLKGASSS